MLISSIFFLGTFAQLLFLFALCLMLVAQVEM